MSKSDKVYEIKDSESGDVLYQCQYATEANRVFDLLRMVCKDRKFVLNVVLRIAL